MKETLVITTLVLILGFSKASIPALESNRASDVKHRPPIRLQDTISLYSLASGIPINLSHAVVSTESSWNPKAVALTPHLNRPGQLGMSVGLYQVNTQHVGKALCPEAKTASDLFDIDTNALCGSRILKYSLGRGKTLEEGLSVYYSGKTNSLAGKLYAERVLLKLNKKF